MRLHTGLDVLCSQDFAPLRGKSIGLVSHAAAVSSNLRTAAELFASGSGIELAALFGPEHGFASAAQDLEGVPDIRESSSNGLPIYSLYGDTVESLKPTPEQLRGLDLLVIDLQDVGSRYYTFQATMLYCLQACAEVGLPVWILDRPNPIGGTQVEGPSLRSAFKSFVGVHPICSRHGMTMGELAVLYRDECVPDAKLTVVPCEGWSRPDAYSWWVPPSPNMPELKTAIVYPGMCLMEGTNLSEGRGTTRPFEYIGFPGVDANAIVSRLRSERLEGVEFLPSSFRPCYQKHAGKTCGGIFLAVMDDRFRPVRTGLAVICAFRSLLGDKFQWRTETYEFVSHIPAIDLLFGSDRERLAIEAGVPWQEIAAAWEPEEAAFRERRKPYLLYEG